MIYARNADLLIEIAKSKNSYCEYVEPSYANYDLIVTSLGDPLINEKREALGREPIVRLMTQDHIPESFIPVRAVRNQTSINFPSFQHFEGNRLVGRSHFHNGEFSINHGNLSPRLALMIMKIVNGMGSKGNWCGYSYVDEMKAEALCNLVKSALKFDESKSDNPFAYLSMASHNSFLKILKDQKKQASIRDDMMFSMGFAPSLAAQNADKGLRI